MRKQSKSRLVPRLAPRVALHFAMGAALGLILGLCLLYFDVAEIRDIIESAFDPAAARTVLGATLALQFGIGAALTGFVLELENA